MNMALLIAAAAILLLLGALRLIWISMTLSLVTRYVESLMRSPDYPAAALWLHRLDVWRMLFIFWRNPVELLDEPWRSRFDAWRYGRD